MKKELDWASIFAYITLGFILGIMITLIIIG